MPAVPKQWLQDGGEVTGLRARGDMEVSLRWGGGALGAARVVFRSRHPWHGGESVTVFLPGSGGGSPSAVKSECATVTPKADDHMLVVDLKSYPCTVNFGSWE